MLIRDRKEKRKKGKEKKVIFIVSLITLCLSVAANGQCAMCRAALESEGNKTKVQAVNDGIVFLMAIPYILVAVIGFTIYKMYYKKK